jgi:hypothetical protein
MQIKAALEVSIAATAGGRSTAAEQVSAPTDRDVDEGPSLGGRVPRLSRHVGVAEGPHSPERRLGETVVTPQR